MSDRIVKLIPVSPFERVPEEALFRAKRFLEAETVCDSVSIEHGDAPMFIDCGGDLEEIVCPACGAAVGFDWWGGEMNRAFEDSFSSLEVTVPCCGSAVSLNDLDYRAPCGFACCVIELLNPRRELSEALLASVGQLLGVSLRVITARV